MIYKNIYLTIFLLLLQSSLVYPESDTTHVLTYDSFIEIVRTHHPLAIQAELQIREGEAVLQSSRGGFDPKLMAGIGQKYFDGSQYYSLADAGLKIPTWMGIELQAGYEQSNGMYLNPENITPETGLAYAGISLPVGQGLFIDKRRAELEKAKKFREISRLEQQVMLNELLYESGAAYWDWFKAYNFLQVYRKAFQLAEERYLAVKMAASLGDAPPIDTLEAGIQVQNRQLSLQQAALNFANASEMLSIYLWIDGLIPLEAEDGTIPVTLDSIGDSPDMDQVLARLDTFVMNHPQLQQYRYKIDQMEIDRRWKKELLKPVLNLKYNALSEPVNGNPFIMYSINNYNWGFEFSFPLFLRKERGEYKLTEIKIQEAQLDLTTKRAGIKFKVSTAINEWNTTREQIVLYTRTVSDYEGLLQGEWKMFEAGESSLFMVNSRELGYIQAQLKLIELLSKNRKASLTTSYALGIL